MSGNNPTLFSNKNQREWCQNLNQVTEKAIAKGQIVGSVVLVAHKDQIIYRSSQGWSDREQQKPMQEDAIFLLSSVTKPMVATAAIRLFEENILSKDDYVSKWLPDFRPRLADGFVPEITLHQLLTHTAGLSYSFIEPNGKGPYHDANVSDGFDMIGVSLKENLSRITKAPLLYYPGESFCYSVALDVLGAVMEAATGKTLPEIVEHYITKPLGINNTAFRIVNQEKFVTHYLDAQPQPRKIKEFDSLVLPDSWNNGVLNYALRRIDDSGSYPSGGAGMAGTAPEFMQFLLSLSQNDGRIFAKNSLAAQQLMQLQVSANAQAQGPGWGFGYLGAMLDVPSLANTPQSKGTIQWGGIYGHSWFYDPVYDITVVGFTNTSVEGLFGNYPIDIRNAIYHL